jgi:hypothetical protein
MKLTKADAARQLGISRTTLYKFIEQGRLSSTPDGLIDQTELVRIAPTLDAHRARHLTPVHITRLDAYTPGIEHHERTVDSVSGQHEQPSTARQLTSTLEAVVDILRGQLQAAQEREALLLRMLHESQQRYDRLLDVPRPAPQAAPPRRRERRTPPPASVPPDPPPGLVDVTTRMPAYNPDTHMLGVLCPQEHDWQGTGQSLRKRSNHRCLACDAAWARAKRRQARA